MRVLDLFSGIGGMSLGLERAGMRTVAFCEIDPYCRRVLARHWPEVPIYDDVRSLTAARLAADGVVFDLIAGGFPCQDISPMGTGEGIDGARSRLWWDMHRIIAEGRPAWCFIENHPFLRGRGLDRILGALAALGYDAEWDCVPASALGASHERDRLWLVAYAAEPGLPVSAGPELLGAGRREEGRPVAVCGGRTDQPLLGRMADGLPSRLDRASDRRVIVPASAAMWVEEPDIPRVARGVPQRVPRLRALGNAVVPQIPEMIGRRIMAAARGER